jgi:cytochrome c biogenesis protein CcmG/thiol:disulfide interchange protein DsbE
MRLKWLVGVGVMALIVVLAVVDRVGALRGGPINPEASVLVNRRAPALVGTEVAGQPYRWHPGKVTVVDIWASWCEPCRSELPMIAAFARRWAARGVQVVTIDTRDGTVPARQFLSQVGARGLVAIHDPDGRLAVTWGATGIPETFVVDATGVIRAHWAGPVDAATLVGEVTRWR